MLAGFAHHGAIAHRHALGGQKRHLIALAKRLKTRNLLDSLDIQLGEVDGGGNLVGVLKVLGGKLGQHGGKATTELIELGCLDGHAHRTGMPAAANQQVGATLDASNRLTLPTERPDPRAMPSSIEKSSAGTW